LSSFGLTYEIFIDMPSGTFDNKLRIAALLDLLLSFDLLHYRNCCTIGLGTLLILAALLGRAALLD
jgi:hypothetical protein